MVSGAYLHLDANLTHMDVPAQQALLRVMHLPFEIE